MAKLLNDIPKHCGSKFDWKCGEGAAESSELKGSPFFSRIYADACDLGFIIVSHKTGTEKLFTLTTEARDGDELRSWHFTSDDGFSVIVFND